MMRLLFRMNCAAWIIALLGALAALGPTRTWCKTEGATACTTGLIKNDHAHAVPSDHGYSQGQLSRDMLCSSSFSLLRHFGTSRGMVRVGCVE